MSGHATSITQVMPVELVPRMRRALEEDDIDAIADFFTTRPSLHGGSRNNHMESCVQQVLEAFPHPGIGYLCRHPAVLEGKELAEAIADSRRFLAFLHAHADACAAHLNLHLFPCTGEQIREEIDRLPVEVEKAIADFRKVDRDADDHVAMLRFLNAHAAILEDARAHGMAVMYCIWLYGG